MKLSTHHQTLALLAACAYTGAFTMLPTTSNRNSLQTLQHVSSSPLPKNKVVASSTTISPTALFSLIDVPEDFFTFTFPVFGILLSISRKISRIRMEERAWEQRLAEGREERLRRDPTVTELDLRRREAELEWSAYGKPRLQKGQQKQKQQEREMEQRQYASKSRVKVKEREEEYAPEAAGGAGSREYRMTDEEIEFFELEYGVDYDPYYDDPYGDDELPEGKFTVDKRYGDRIYEDGEIFYRDASSGLFYRQGAKPRNLSYWN